jgi:hypothetical protein
VLAGVDRIPASASKGPLLNELNRLESNARSIASIYRSVVLIQVEGAEKKIYDLRAQLNRDDGIQNFTVTSHSNLRTNSPDGWILFHTRDNQIIFGMKYYPATGDLLPRLVIAKQVKDKSIFNEFRIHYFIEREGRGLTLVPYASNAPDQKITKEGSIPLTTFEAPHFPVLKLDEGEYIPDATEGELLDLVEGLGLIENQEQREEILEKTKSIYKRCVIERARVRASEHLQSKDQTLKEGCLRVQAIEGVNLWFREELLTVVGKKEASLTNNLLSCFNRGQFFERVNSMRAANWDKLDRISHSDFKRILDLCVTGVRSEIGRITLTEELSGDPLVSRSMVKGVKNETLVDDVIVKGRDLCLEIAGTGFHDACTEMAREKAMGSLFQSLLAQKANALSSRLNIPVVEFRKKVGDEFMACEEKSLEMASHALKKESSHIKLQSLLKNCAVDAFIKFELLVGESGLIVLLREIPALKEQLPDESTLSGSNVGMQICLKEELSQLNSVREIVEHAESIRFGCAMTSVRSTAPHAYAKTFKKSLETLFREEIDVGLIMRDIARYIERYLGPANSTAEVQEILKVMAPQSYAIIVQAYIESRMKFAGSMQDEARKALRLVIPFDRPTKRDIESYFKTIHAREGIRGLEVISNDIYRRVEQVISPLYLRDVLSDSLLVEKERDEYADKIDEVYQQCMNTYRPNTSMNLDDLILTCEKKRSGRLLFLLAKRGLDRDVSMHFPLSSPEANNILSPVNYLFNCIEGMEKRSDTSFDEYERLIHTCVFFTKIDISNNIARTKIDSMMPILSKVRGQNPLAVSSQCYVDILGSVLETLSVKDEAALASGLARGQKSRKLVDIFRAAHAAVPGAGALLSQLSASDNPDYEYRHGDAQVLNELITLVSHEPRLQESWATEKGEKCLEVSSQQIYSSFREYVVKSLPMVYSSGLDPKVVSDVMYSFLDLDLVEMLLRFIKVKSDIIDVRGASVVPSERLVTPELALTSLSNFVTILGQYISQGFVFDYAGMKTELVVFQGELKDFLGWYINSPSEVKIGDTEEFFKGSKLADHLSLAVVSKNTRDQFDRFLNQMESAELAKFPLISERTRGAPATNRTRREKRAEVTARFVRLKTLATTMTKAYDFKRIVRPESQGGERLLAYIKERYLLPLIMGYPNDPRVEASVREKVAQLILADNTAGGFAERFVKEVAQHQLNSQSNSTWGITKWLFYDTGDFNWERLRSTKSGQEAMTYYGRYLLLPRILGQELSHENKALREKRFNELLKKAQSENDD